MVLINGLTGMHFVLSERETEIFRGWKRRGIMENEASVFLIDLLKNGLVFRSDKEEDNAEQLILSKAKAKYEKEKRSLKTATFVLTYDCNFNCPYCYERNIDSNGAYKHMTKQQIDAIFSYYNEYIEWIILYGGEPLLEENKEIIEYIFKRGADSNYTITTNGYMLLEYMELLKGIKLKRLMVTIDGDKEEHNRRRVLKGQTTGTFNKIIAGIELALKNNISVKIRMNVSADNIDSCLELREQLKNDYLPYYKCGLLMFELQALFQHEKKLKDDINERILPPHIYNREKWATSDNTMTRKVSRLLQPFFNKNTIEPMYCACGAESHLRFYDCEGYVYSCALALGKPSLSIGTYYPKIERKTSGYMFRNIEAIEKCKDCVLKFLCGGGCSNTIIDSNGNNQFPNCSQIQHELNDVLPRIYRRILDNRVV